MIAEAVALKSICRSGDRAFSNAVQTAMEQAAARAHRDQVEDPAEVRARIMDAREGVYVRRHRASRDEGTGLAFHAAQLQSAALVQAAPAQAGALLALLKIDRPAALGAALAFLIQSATDDPGLLRHVLTQTRVSNGARSLSALELLNHTAAP